MSNTRALNTQASIGSLIVDVHDREWPLASSAAVQRFGSFQGKSGRSQRTLETTLMTRSQLAWRRFAVMQNAASSNCRVRGGGVCPHGHDYDPFPENGVIYALKVGIALIHINMVQRVHAYLPSGCLRQINLTSGTISERLMAIRFGVAPRHS
ncbi:MAG: hypothetical protein ABSG18_27360, partial [Steroidobacteraceae bacterium]